VNDWKKLPFHSLPFAVIVETKNREFQYKILNDIIYTNDKLFRFKMIESPLCTFCQKEDESLEHLLFRCYATKKTFGLHSHLGLVNKTYQWKR